MHLPTRIVVDIYCRRDTNGLKFTSAYRKALGVSHQEACRVFEFARYTHVPLWLTPAQFGLLVAYMRENEVELGLSHLKTQETSALSYPEQANSNLGRAA